MLYRALADITLVVHLGFVLFVALGGLLVLCWPKLAWLHLPAVAWGVYIELTGHICPLTPLEVTLRTHGGEAGYQGGFIEHYVQAWLYPEGLTHEVQTALGIGVFVINAAIYTWAIYMRIRRGRSTRQIPAHRLD